MFKLEVVWILLNPMLRFKPYKGNVQIQFSRLTYQKDDVSNPIRAMFKFNEVLNYQGESVFQTL